MPSYVIVLIVGAVLVAISAVLYKSKFKLKLGVPVLLLVATLALSYQLWRHLPFISWVLGVWVLLIIGLVLLLLKLKLLSVIASLLAAILLIIGGGLGPVVANWFNSDAPSSDSTTPSATATTPAPDPTGDTSTDDSGLPADLTSLIADPPTFDCVALATKYNLPTKEIDGKTYVVFTYIPNEVGSDTNQRDDTNSVNVSAIPAERDRVLASVCTQPEMAGMAGTGLANEPVGNGDSGKKFAELNSALLNQFVNTTPKAWADKVFGGEVSYTDAASTMSQLAGLLAIFQWGDSPETKATTWNYEAEPTTSSKGNVRPIVLNDQQYTGDFLVLRLTSKGETYCLGSNETIGFNVGVGGDVNKGDQRLAGFNISCKTTTTPPPATTTTTPPTHTGSTPPPDTHTTPPPTDVCPNIPGTQPTVPSGYTLDNGKCLAEKLHTDDVTPPAGTTPQGPGRTTTEDQGTGAGTSGNAATSGTPHSDTGTSVPVGGATPAPAAPAPAPVATQAPAASSPGTSSGDPDS